MIAAFWPIWYDKWQNRKVPEYEKKYYYIFRKSLLMPDDNRMRRAI